MRARKIDDNQAAIVKGLRDLGCFVQSLASVGKGCPDLLVGYKGRWHTLEIKDGDKAASAQKLSPAEVEWILAASQRAPVHVVRSLEDAVDVVTGKQTDCEGI